MILHVTLGGEFMKLVERSYDPSQDPPNHATLEIL